VHARAGANASAFQEFQQVTVTLVDSTYDIILSGFSMGEQHQASATAAAGTFKFA
jgi:hypothetical protein